MATVTFFQTVFKKKCEAHVQPPRSFLNYIKVRVQSLFPKNGRQQHSEVLKLSDREVLDLIVMIVLLQPVNVVT